ncbi:MAG: hypothetical protein HOQ24_09080, partial [Mycobacteriaceae bacterium]|nr:hypothetical protein [Mycobacteriaceae bacterium]
MSEPAAAAGSAAPDSAPLVAPDELHRLVVGMRAGGGSADPDFAHQAARAADRWRAPVR